tara:strand:+ start:125 stop:523 length:399 start_codon:yes stop_codon:yes gene_type:complete
MATIVINFDHDINDSLQIGDDVYYCPNQSRGGFDTVDNANIPSTGIVRIGNCTVVDREINGMSILVNPDLNVTEHDFITNGIGLGDFIMFSKSNQANLSSLLGYYAEVTLQNDSPEEAELFAISAEVSESSK